MRRKIVALLCVGSVAAIAATGIQQLKANAQKPVATALKYQMKLILLADASPSRFILTVSDQEFSSIGFSSLASPQLRERVGSVYPTGSTIEYAPSCRRIGGEPTQQQLDAFDALCKSKGIKFVIIPSG